MELLTQDPPKYNKNEISKLGEYIFSQFCIIQKPSIIDIVGVIVIFRTLINSKVVEEKEKHHKKYTIESSP